jgi:caa(3)-type oxidase subunit IV
MSQDDHGHQVNYLVIFLVLCVCTALSVAFDILAFSKPVTIVLVIAIACAKAMCVMMFFMHLKFEGNWKFILLAPTTILALGLPLALMPDVGVAYYQSTAPQTTKWADEIAQYEATHHDESSAEH